MKNYTYDELKEELEHLKQAKSDLLGSCCNCGTDVFKSILHTTFFFEGQEDKHLCKDCDSLMDELFVFCCLLSCAQGTISWDIFKEFK